MAKRARIKVRSVEKSKERRSFGSAGSVWKERGKKKKKAFKEI
jgi:hypothetical protein